MEHAREASAYICAYPEASVRAILSALALQTTFQGVLDDPAAEQALEAPALHPLLEHAAT
jgi:hypothetical protein